MQVVELGQVIQQLMLVVVAVVLLLLAQP